MEKRDINNVDVIQLVLVFMMKSLSSHIKKILKYSKLNIECIAPSFNALFSSPGGHVSKSYNSMKKCNQADSKRKSSKIRSSTSDSV